MKHDIEEHSYRSKDKCNGDIWHWFEILRISDAIIILICKPYGIDNLLYVFVAKEALSISLCGTHFLENISVR